MIQASRAIAVFAHNEEKKILSCLESIKRANNGRQIRCFVLANGCTDCTYEIVSNFSMINNFVEIIKILPGDKSNTWNTFVHKVSPKEDIYYFIDGGCEVLPNSLDELEKCIRNDKNANIETSISLDIGGTNKKQIKDMINNGELTGNYYALSMKFFENLKYNNVYLPFGLIGDDFLLVL